MCRYSRILGHAHAEGGMHAFVPLAAERILVILNGAYVAGLACCRAARFWSLPPRQH